MNRAAVVDTNIVVSGLLTSDPGSPTAVVLDGMLSGRFPFLLSEELLAEYRAVLLRPAIRKAHELSERQVDAILIAIVANAIIREPVRSDTAPDRGDQHLWDLFTADASAILITGDALLLRKPPRGRPFCAAAFVKSLD